MSFDFSVTHFKDFLALLRGRNIIPFDGTVSFEEPENADRPFAPHYEQYIRPRVRAFEKNRIKVLHILRKRVLVSIPVFSVLFTISLLVFLSVPSPSERSLDVFSALLLLYTVVLYQWCYMPVRKYKSAVKGKIFPDIFSFFGENYQYSEKGLLSVDSLKPSHILPHYAGASTEDYIKGSYKGVVLELTEAKLVESRSVSVREGFNINDSALNFSFGGRGEAVVRAFESSRNDKTVFQGMFILLSMNKNFSGNTIVKLDSGKIFNWLSDKLNKADHKMARVTLEDPVFEKKFEVYSSDQVEARYLLTTSFMERLLKLSALFGRSGVQCSFYDDKLLLMISSRKNRFETGSVFLPATFTEDINDILKEMHMIFQIVDVLKLDQRTGL